MKGFPKHLNSKADYLYVKANFPRDKWLPAWKALLTNRQYEICTGVVDSADAGVTDETHRIVVSEEQDYETGEKKTVYYQYELRDNPRADFFRFGFTEEEVNKAIAGE